MSGTATLKNRRNLLRLAVAAAGAAAGCGGAHRADVGGRGPQMVERARALGREYMTKYGNCCQCTIAALQNGVEIAPKDEKLFEAGSALGSAATISKVANCGGFTGSAIVLGGLGGRTRGGFSDPEAGRRATQCVQELAARFDREYGSVLCREVRAKAGQQCQEVVARAAGWAAEIMLAQFSNAGGRSAG